MGALGGVVLGGKPRKTAGAVAQAGGVGTRGRTDPTSAAASFVPSILAWSNLVQVPRVTCA